MSLVLAEQGAPVEQLALHLPEGLSVEQWAETGQMLSIMSVKVQWLIGDWWAYGEAAQYADRQTVAAGLSIDPKTLDHYARVSRAIEPALRSAPVPYSHFKEVAALEDSEERAEFIQKAADEGWTVRRLREELNGGEGEERERRPKAQETPRFGERRDEAAFSVTQASTRLADAVAVVKSPGFRLTTAVAQDLLREVAKVDRARAELLEVIDEEVGDMGISVPTYTPPARVIPAQVSPEGGNATLRANAGKGDVSLGGISDSIGDRTVTIEDYYAQVGR